MTTQSKQAIPKQRIGLYGGAFDPVHEAHLKVAGAALKQASLDKVVFIPASQSPLKTCSSIATDAERLEMLSLAIANEAGFLVDDYDLRRGGMSYSIDTVRYFQKREPESEFCWIIGADQLVQLEDWYEVDELVRMVTFLVVLRPGYGISSPDIDGLNWTTLEAPLMEESSTLIREKIAEGEPLEGYLPKSVEAFIHKKGLYI